MNAIRQQHGPHSARKIGLAGLTLLVVAPMLAACAGRRPAPAAPVPPPRVDSVVTVAPPPPPPPTPAPEPTPVPVMTATPVDPTDGAGTVRWVGRDADRTLGTGDRALLRTVFGVDDVRRLYIPAAAGDVIRYAARAPGCPDAGTTIRVGSGRGGCRVVSVRVGFAAPRAAGETWDAYVARVVRGGSRAWTAGGRTQYAGLDALDPEVRGAFQHLVDDARAAGFPVHVRETYRSPERQAFVLARGDGRTTTATSAHSYGRAADLSIGDGRIGRASTHRTWVDFRRWVLTQQGGAFRLIGTPERTWDWPHVEYAGSATGGAVDSTARAPGYRTVDALVAAARACRAGATTDAEAAARCTVTPPGPGEARAVIVDEGRGSRRSTRRGRHASHKASRAAKGHRSGAHGAKLPAPKHSARARRR